MQTLFKLLGIFSVECELYRGTYHHVGINWPISPPNNVEVPIISYQYTKSIKSVAHLLGNHLLSRIDIRKEQLLLELRQR